MLLPGKGGRRVADRPTPGRSSPFGTISGRWLAADPVLLLRTLAYYVVHPADRHELGSEAALRRAAVIAKAPWFCR